MKREIKFRGKRFDNIEWTEGCLTRYSEHMSYIIVDLVENERHQVDTKTIGQYTGLKDKNGTGIYEGDIVFINKNINNNLANEKAIVEFYANSWCVDLSKFYPLCREGWCQRIKGNMSDYFEVIGNIYDNPEFITGGDK